MFLVCVDTLFFVDPRLLYSGGWCMLYVCTLSSVLVSVLADPVLWFFVYRCLLLYEVLLGAFIFVHRRITLVVLGDVLGLCLVLCLSFNITTNYWMMLCFSFTIPTNCVRCSVSRSWSVLGALFLVHHRHELYSVLCFPFTNCTRCSVSNSQTVLGALFLVHCCQLDPENCCLVKVS